MARRVQTRVVRVDPDLPDPGLIEEAASILRAGGLVAFPTETVYGLGASATNPTAVARIFEAKGRPSTNPLIIHGDDTRSVRQATIGWTLTATRLARVFWPGPLTLVLSRNPQIPDLVTAGLSTVGVRTPDSPVALALLREAGLVAAPSANLSTKVSPTRAEHLLKDLDGLVELVLDAGPCRVGIESTVLDLTQSRPRVLRPGVITCDAIERVSRVGVESQLEARSESEPASSPGQLAYHYAPKARVILLDHDEIASGFAFPDRERHGLIRFRAARPAWLPAEFKEVELNSPERAAAELYATFHRWDDQGVDRIYIERLPADEPWRAIADRVWRASRRWDQPSRTESRDGIE
jgi:L-threonylcarbamoyladenylate synthase